MPGHSHRVGYEHQKATYLVTILLTLTGVTHISLCGWLGLVGY